MAQRVFEHADPRVARSKLLQDLARAIFGAAVGEQELDGPVEALRLHRGDALADVLLLVEHGNQHADVDVLLGNQMLLLHHMVSFGASLAALEHSFVDVLAVSRCPRSDQHHTLANES